MPLYEYRCERGHTFEVMQRMSDEPVTVCEVCGAPVHRVFHPVAVHFKGSGFYTTDYGRKGKSAAGASSDEGGGKSSSSDSGSSDKATKKESAGEKSGSSSGSGSD